jgi:glycosyltransferase involved in cell wall biosynthesis
MDLMRQQVLDGHQVALLWPGEIKLLDHAVKIHADDYINGIASFEIKNPQPIPYDEGITAVQAFQTVGDKAVYEAFLEQWKPDVIHIHTLMGLHRAFLTAAKEKKIRLVFTAHDFFPICPKVTLFRRGRVCASAGDCNECVQCNRTALALWKGRVLQHPLYRSRKDRRAVKKLRQHHRDACLRGNEDAEPEAERHPHHTAEDYQKLRSHYRSMLQLMDRIHYNSSVTRQAYETYLGPFPAMTLAITHLDVQDHRRKKQFGERLRLTYLGPQGRGKGFFCLKAALDLLWNENRNFELNIFFEPTENADYMRVNPRYSYAELEAIFEKTDLLAAPSLWYETFGYTVLEAMSFGVPVLVSGTVGAKDLIPDGAGIVLADISEEKIYEALRAVTPDKLARMNQVLCEKFTVPTVEAMACAIETLCYRETNEHDG